MVISEYEITNFCDLPKEQNQLVYIRGIYSGVEEYWSLNSGTDKCKELHAELDIPENITIKTKFKRLFENVHRKYWDRHLIIDAVGTFETGDKFGYGHLGSNKSNFKVKKIINVQLVIRKK